MTHRFLDKRYTDADVLALYMKYREERIGPFVREVGDFIAHAKRDRGATLERTAFVFSQVAFILKCQSGSNLALEFSGECGWWLKTWLLENIDFEPMSVLKNISGLNKKQLKKKVASWFAGNTAYPTEIACDSPALFYDLVVHLSGKIVVRPPFEKALVKKEVTEMLGREGIPISEVEPIIVATMVLLQGKSTEIVDGFSARIELSIGEPRWEQIPGLPMPSPGQPGYALRLPDGNLCLSVATTNNRGDGLTPIALDLLDTEIDTEKYFCRSLVETDEHGRKFLNLRRALTFERNAERMVFPTKP
ncbi:hypothetical protein CEW88_04775 [Alloyangia pacifica]|uniref:Uncharacterized protein n=1 Tax=Alloyangia pacifica TaxID=311180 RepID=A0A2U8HB99_9RHOB|nr:hypothetical protein [Alloyangia pacifica]AWI83034.1 hypothetical protein CEW88_04775 [Alloyangia pacifica]